MTETDHREFQGHSWERLDQGPGGGQAPGCPCSDPAGSPGRASASCLLPTCIPRPGAGSRAAAGTLGEPLPTAHRCGGSFRGHREGKGGTSGESIGW